MQNRMPNGNRGMHGPHGHGPHGHGHGGMRGGPHGHGGMHGGPHGGHRPPPPNGMLEHRPPPPGGMHSEHRPPPNGEIRGMPGGNDMHGRGHIPEHPSEHAGSPQTASTNFGGNLNGQNSGSRTEPSRGLYERPGAFGNRGSSDWFDSGRYTGGIPHGGYQNTRGTTFQTEHHEDFVDDGVHREFHQEFGPPDNHRMIHHEHHEFDDGQMQYSRDSFQYRREHVGRGPSNLVLTVVIIVLSVILVGLVIRNISLSGNRAAKESTSGEFEVLQSMTDR